MEGADTVQRSFPEAQRGEEFSSNDEDGLRLSGGGKSRKPGTDSSINVGSHVNADWVATPTITSNCQ